MACCRSQMRRKNSCNDHRYDSCPFGNDVIKAGMASTLSSAYNRSVTFSSVLYKGELFYNMVSILEGELFYNMVSTVCLDVIHRVSAPNGMPAVGGTSSSQGHALSYSNSFPSTATLLAKPRFGTQEAGVTAGGA